MTRRNMCAGLCAALCLGALLVPATASAAPANNPTPTFTTIGRDGLAPYADAAMNAWVDYLGGDKMSLRRFNLIRDSLALEAGRRLGIDGMLLVRAWRKADRTHQLALVAAITQLGTPYHTNQSNPGVGFDCSGLTSWAWSQSGVGLPHQSGGQIRTVSQVDLSAVQPGDGRVPDAWRHGFSRMPTGERWADDRSQWRGWS